MRTNLIKIENKQPIVDGKLDMVIAFDTTGSMSSYIDQVKDHVKSLVPQLRLLWYEECYCVWRCLPSVTSY